MVTYVVGTVLSMLISVFIYHFWGFEKKRTLKMFISLLPLTLISAFRYDVGWDYLDIYTMGFYLVGKYKMKWFTEGLFRLIIKILYYFFTDQPLSLFILMSSLTSYFFSLCFSVYGRVKKPFVYILLFVITRYYFCSLNIMRQALAMIIIMYAIHYIKERKIWKYFFFILLASGFHLMSLIYIPLYFVLSFDLKKIKNIFYLVVSVPFVLGIGYLFVSGTKYSQYFLSMFGNDGTIYYTELLISVVILFLGFGHYDKIRENVNIRVMYNMELLALLCCFASIFLPTGDRIIWYFSINNIFLIPYLLELFVDVKTKLFFTIITFIALLCVFVSQSLDDSYSVFPYQNIIEQKK